MKEQTTDQLRSTRRQRSEQVEDEVHGVFRDEATPMDDRATNGATILANKLVEDVEEQFEHFCALKSDPTHSASFVDHELCKLLRMMEKRKAMIASLEAALEKAGTLVIES